MLILPVVDFHILFDHCDETLWQAKIAVAVKDLGYAKLLIALNLFFLFFRAAMFVMLVMKVASVVEIFFSRAAKGGQVRLKVVGLFQIIDSRYVRKFLLRYFPPESALCQRVS